MKTPNLIRHCGGAAFAVITSLALLPGSYTLAETANVTALGTFKQKFPPKNGPFELYTQVTFSAQANKAYIVMPDEWGIPKVTQITDGSPAVVDTVSLEPDKKGETDYYRALNDAHNGFSIGIDESGYIHIAGDMHSFGFSDGRQGATQQPPDSPQDYQNRINQIYPLRFQFNNAALPVSERATILYWVSNNPWDIKGGFTFRGKAGDSRRIPGIGWSYGRFFNDMNGRLYYSSRTRALRNRYIGALGVGLYAYNAGTKTWSARGGKPTSTISQATESWNPADPGPETVLFWSEAGEPPTAAKPGAYRSYQVYQAGFNFDRNNRLHFVVSGWVDLEGKARVLYATSTDFGVTWKRADLTAINGSILRGDWNATGQGQMTIVYPEVAPTLLLDYDKNVAGRQSVKDANPFNDAYWSGVPNATYITKVFSTTTGDPIALHGVKYDDWRVWNRTTRTWQAGSAIRGIAGTIASNGPLTSWSEYGIWRNGTSTNLYSGGIISPSQLGIARTGKIYGLAKAKDAQGVDYMTGRKITFTP